MDFANSPPRITFQSGQIIVMDDFLDAGGFDRVLDYCGQVEYRSVHSNLRSKVWRIGDGVPLQGPTTYWTNDRDAFAPDEQRPLHPTGSAIDIFIDRLVFVLHYAEQLIGSPVNNWFDFSVAPWIYPAGSGLSLHQDGFSYSGAYTYFAHRSWNVHWGGYLLVMDPRTSSPRYHEILGPHVFWIDDEKESNPALEPGFAHCIFPRPNRLVLIGPEAQHLLSRVDANAGNRPRISIAGFSQEALHVTPQEHSKCPHDGDRPRIFLQIASYRDPDCQWTVKDLFDKAAFPERIFVGICWQFVEDEDQVCFQEAYSRPGQVRVRCADARRSRGVCWARSVAQELWAGEEFTLQLDSHMRFEPGWDEILLAIWANCRNEKAVLSSYMPGFSPPDFKERQWIFGMSAARFDQDKILTFVGAPAWEVGGGEPNRPVPGAFVAASMLFGPASIISDVPYDPGLYFFGEEVSLSVRLWTSGYDIYHPNRLVLFHNWERSARRTHFEDHPDWPALHSRAVARVHRILKMSETGGSTEYGNASAYGLGIARTLEQFEQYAGVDFADLTFDEKAAQCNFF